MRILIVGHGVVGKNLEKELEVLHPDVIDKYKPEENKIEVPYGVRYDIAFICVDTPIRKEERVLCDTSEVKNAIMENEAEIYVIKSTVSPGTTEQLRVKTGKRIIFSPEYYGGTQHCNNFRFDFTILGGERKAYYTEECETFQEAVSMAVWNPKNIDLERLDDGTSDIDTLDAFEYTWERDIGKYIKKAT